MVPHAGTAPQSIGRGRLDLFWRLLLFVEGRLAR